MSYKVDKMLQTILQVINTHPFAEMLLMNMHSSDVSLRDKTCLLINTNKSFSKLIENLRTPLIRKTHSTIKTPAFLVN